MERREDEDEDESLDEAARAAAVPQRTNWLPDEDLALIRTFVHVRVPGPSLSTTPHICGVNIFIYLDTYEHI
jgi:hypothetical protein